LWSQGEIKTVTGSGFAVSVNISGIPKNVILTNYHVVEDFVLVEVISHNINEIYSAQVITTSPELDIAVLSVEDNNFWSQLNPFKLDSTHNPTPGEKISILGYPSGGNAHSTTNGVISRHVVKTVNHGLPQVLIQVDAAVNKGSSGGPAVLKSSEKVIGMTTGNIRASQNVSYIIPSQTIIHVLEGITSLGKRVGCCSLGIKTVPAQNKGCIVTDVATTGPCRERIKVNDIITEIDGKSVKNELLYISIMRTKYEFETVSIKVIRKGKSRTVVVPLNKTATELLPAVSEAIDKHYYIFAGLDFASLNQRYILSSDSHEPPDFNKSILHSKYKQKFAKESDSQVVILKNIMTSEMTMSYQTPFHKSLILKKINGTKVNKLKDVYDICETRPHNKTVDIQFTLKHPFTGNTSTITLNHVNALDACEHIAQMYVQKSYHNFA
jgi:S1-C subfamily serine protease